MAQEPKDEPIKQIKLTEAQVKSFISAQPDLATVAPKLQDAGDNVAGPADGARQHRQEARIRDVYELDDVAANISSCHGRAQFQVGDFTEPVEALKKELTDVTADASIPDGDKKQLIDELERGDQLDPAARTPGERRTCQSASSRDRKSVTIIVVESLRITEETLATDAGPHGSGPPRLRSAPSRCFW